MSIRRTSATLTAIVALSTISIQTSSAQEPAAKEAEPTVHPSVAHLNEDKRDELRDLLQEASKLAQSQRSQEMLLKLDEAAVLAPDYFGIHNLRGVAYSHLRKFELAKAEFQKAQKLEPKALDVQFNIAEMDFVSHKFDLALAQFEKLIKDNPKLPTGTYQLLQYKVVISKLKLGQEAEAKKIMDTLTPYEDTPIFHMTKAAYEFSKDNEDEAQSWIRSARGIYTAQQVANFLDALIEVDWVESLAKPTPPKNG